MSLAVSREPQIRRSRGDTPTVVASDFSLRLAYSSAPSRGHIGRFRWGQLTPGTPKSSDMSSGWSRSEEHTSELQSRPHLVCRLLLEKKRKYNGLRERIRLRRYCRRTS